MKMLINRPIDVVAEMVEGLVAIHPGLRRLPGRTVIVRSDAGNDRDRRVALISGGGSGHEPAHAGYVGSGMLSAAVAGDVFTSPSPDAVLEAIRAVAGKAGALLIVKNYTGDRLNFGLAAELARAEGIPVEIVTVADDVALPISELTAGPRGLAGTVLVHKIAGATAEAGGSLAEVASEARAAALSVATMGVALSACTVPAAGKPGFVLGENEIELGLGIHGEPGVRRAPLEPVDALVDRLLEPILGRFQSPPSRVVLMVNGLGGTTNMELAIVARRALSNLTDRGIVVERAYAGTFLSALEMAGVSLSLLEVDEARLKRLDAPTEAPAWPNAAPRSRVEPETAEPAPGDATAAPTPVPIETEVGRELKAAITRAAEALIAEASRLTEMDQLVGDGDIGISLARGAGAVVEELPVFPLDDPAATLQRLGTTLQRSLGGTSGPLYAMFFLRAAARLRDNPRAFGEAFQSGVEGIMNLGGAKGGERTMLDALIPASGAFDQALKSGRSFYDALNDAASAASQGAEATATMSPRKGRSSYLGDRALGHPDPGAEAVAVWLRAIASV
ncbi:dihydroxyacetone kinase subunit DhaL [Tundrisphaera lichenicola]|uniref:dihydroxyacetone kinase subunit DhaL n=1 Tax=Tundrisphaera lichenicola TaxID=2029860 RepID=UPI003EBB35C5